MPVMYPSHVQSFLLILYSGLERISWHQRCAGWSTMFPDDRDVSDNMGIFLDHALPTLEGIDKTLGNRAAGVLKRAGPRWLFNALWRPIVANMLSKKEICTCRLVTISHIIAGQVDSRLSLC